MARECERVKLAIFAAVTHMFLFLLPAFLLLIVHPVRGVTRRRRFRFCLCVSACIFRSISCQYFASAPSFGWCILSYLTESLISSDSPAESARTSSA